VNPLVVQGLRVDFPGDDGPASVLAGLDLSVAAGECVALLGESGAGKTVAALACLGLLPPTARVRGEVRLGGTDFLPLPEGQRCHLRGRVVGYVPQSAARSFDPRWTIGDQVAEVIRVHLGVSWREARVRAADLLSRTGLPARAARALPHVLSGGMVQRAAIAAAVAAGPAVLLADEPTSALDTDTEDRVLTLLAGLRDAGMAVLLATHDIRAARAVAGRAAILSDGHILEVGRWSDLASSRHPATRALTGLEGNVP
jgi:ABC-type glutathione transport system ATPase component